MGFFDKLRGGVTGFLTGGPAGAVAGLLGSGNDQRGGSAPAPVANVAGIGQQPQQPAADSMAFLRGYLDTAAANAKPPTTYSAQGAVSGGGSPQRLQQLNNQLGGMAYPERPGAALFKGEGQGGAGGGTQKSNSFLWGMGPAIRERQQQAATAQAAQQSANDLWRQGAVGILSQHRTGYTPQLQGAFGNYMQSALAGQETLPQSSFMRAQQQGMDTINAQAQRGREQLMTALGSRGLGQSGLAARGLAQVETGRLGSMGSLAGGLAQQGLEAARESQRQAAGLVPALAQVDQQASQNQLHGWLAMRQLELEAQRIGISQQQIDDARASGDYNGLASLVGGLTQLFGGNHASAGTGGGAYAGSNGGYWDFYPDNQA